MNVLHIASEVAPFSKTGGLGDVLAALPPALSRQGEGRLRPCVVSARYGFMQPQRYGLAQRLRKVAVPLGGTTYEVSVWEGRLHAAQVPLYLIEHPLLSDRPGLYTHPDRPSEDYADNGLALQSFFDEPLSPRAALQPAARGH